MDYTESGLHIKIENKIKSKSALMFSNNILYMTTEEFLNDNIKFDGLVVDNFQKLFITYFIICLVILICFVFEHCYPRTKRLILFFVMIAKKLIYQ